MMNLLQRHYAMAVWILICAVIAGSSPVEWLQAVEGIIVGLVLIEIAKHEAKVWALRRSEAKHRHPSHEEGKP